MDTMSTSTNPKLNKPGRYMRQSFKRKAHSEKGKEGSGTSESAEEGNPLLRTLTWLCIIGGCVLAVVVFLVGTIVLLGYLIYHPTLPSFTVKEATLNTLLLNTALVLSSNNTILLHVHNPNAKVTVVYESLRFELQFERHPISSYTLEPFSQLPKNTTERLFIMTADGVQLETKEGEDLSYSVQKNGVSYDFVGTVRTKAKFGSISSIKYWLHIRCHMEFSPPPPVGNRTMVNSHCNSRK